LPTLDWFSGVTYKATPLSLRFSIGFDFFYQHFYLPLLDTVEIEGNAAIRPTARPFCVFLSFFLLRLLSFVLSFFLSFFLYTFASAG